MFGDPVPVEDLLIEGDLTARTVGDEQPRLLAALTDFGHVRLHLGDQMKVDVCGIQLIESARKFAAGNFKTVSLAKPAGEALTRLLAALGFTDPAAGDSRVFWLHEEPAQ